MPFYLAQLVPTLGWSAADVMSINGCGISLFKMLFVSHFDLIFSQDPELLGRLVLGLSLLLGCVPHCVICIHHSAQRIKVAPMVSFYMGEPLEVEDSLMMMYGSFWCIVSLFLLAMAVLFIPIYLKRHQQAAVLSAERNMSTPKTISLTKVLFGSSCVALVVFINYISHAAGLSAQFPVQAPLTALSVGLLLTFLTLDDHIKHFIEQKIRIKIQNLRGGFYFYRSTTINPA